MVVISQGAEAVIHEVYDRIVKIRIAKSYREKNLDLSLRSFRTRREAKIMKKLKNSGNLNVPMLSCHGDGKRIYGEIPEDIDVLSDKDTFLVMENITGNRLKDYLDDTNYVSMMKSIGSSVASMHSSDIVHGDLTTSNMILSDDGKLYLIDFGLSVFSEKMEDKAVDIHLLKQALESGHPKIWEDAFDFFMRSYKSHYDSSDEVLARLEKVEKRGRYKKKAKKDAGDTDV